MWIAESTPIHPFLFSEGNLGVPQKVLYKAYMVAIHAYFDLRSESRKTTPSLQQSNLLDRLTRVVLLANPSHQTALNSRKKLIENDIVDPHWELGFSRSLLSCRECAKESILWHHRRWLLDMIHGIPATVSTERIPEITPLNVLEAEFACASIACHLYPRNYHAWTHRRFCAEALVASLQPEVPSDSGVFAEEYQKTLQWIESHIKDYSAMNYAVNLEKMLIGRKPAKGRSSTKEHATSLLRSYPDHESLWVYLRGSVTSGGEKELLASITLPSARKFVLRHTVWRKISVGFFSAIPTVNFLK